MDGWLMITSKFCKPHPPLSNSFFSLFIRKGGSHNFKKVNLKRKQYRIFIVLILNFHFKLSFCTSTKNAIIKLLYAYEERMTLQIQLQSTFEKIAFSFLFYQFLSVNIFEMDFVYLKNTLHMQSMVLFQFPQTNPQTESPDSTFYTHFKINSIFKKMMNPVFQERITRR